MKIADISQLSGNIEKAKIGGLTIKSKKTLDGKVEHYVGKNKLSKEVLQNGDYSIANGDNITLEGKSKSGGKYEIHHKNYI